jgi:hypothetical protein
MLIRAILLLTLSAAGPTTPPAAAEAPFTPAMARHLLNRAGFGGTPEQIAALVDMGLDGAVDHLVGGSRRGDDRGLEPFVAEPLSRPPPATLRGLSEEERRELRRSWRRRDMQQLQRFRAWWLDRMVSTPTPLTEKLTLFWHGYFTSSYRDVRNSYQLIAQNGLFREHGLGNFRLLLHEVARDPAMLEYLDNNKNRKGAPNENFAREVMELFTLGAGNYSEDDIKEAARAFTGWTARGNRFVFVSRLHDDGTKTILGRKGRFDGTDALDIMLARPEASELVASRLLRYFVGPELPRGMVARYGRLLRRHQWELAPVMKALFRDPDFYRPEVVGSRILGPVEFLVGISRRLGETPGGEVLVRFADQLGQSLLDPPNVKGWEGGEAWITTATFLQRGNLAGYLVAGFSPRQILEDFSDEDLRDMSAEERRTVMQGVRGMFGRGGRRLRWSPQRRLQDVVRSTAASSVEEIVDQLCARFLGVAVTDESRLSLIALLRDATGSSADPSEAALRRVVHVILSLPEAQLG